MGGTLAPALPEPYGADGYRTPLDVLRWTPPSWYEPSVPQIVRQDPIGATVDVPVIAMIPVYKGPGTYVRPYDSLPDNGYPLLTPTNPPIPYATMGGGLHAPVSPAPGEHWKIYNQYSPWLHPREAGGDAQPSGPGVWFANDSSYTRLGAADARDPAPGFY